MAFELPTHLPRGGIPQDRPTQVLNKVGQATSKTLDASLAASWLAELDVSIKDTKDRISKRIHEDLPTFERQHEASRFIQKRLVELSTEADVLDDGLHNPKTGTLPILLQTLATHATLASQANDSEATYRVLEHLLRLKDGLSEVSNEMLNGKLPEAAEGCLRVQELIVRSPGPLERADVMAGVKKRFRTLNDRVQEQLNDAYSRSVVFTSSVDGVALTIIPTTIIPAKSTLITLSAILSSLSPDFLSNCLNIFRRDLLSKIVEPILSSSRAVTVSSSESSAILSLSSALASPLSSLRTVTNFLNIHFYPNIPQTQTLFPSTLHVPISTAILDHLLKPHLPSNIHALSAYLDMLDDAVHFEEELFTTVTRNRPIRYWAEEIANHYEKKRREEYLEKARTTISGREDGTTFRVVIDVKQPSPPPPPPVVPEVVPVPQPVAPIEVDEELEDTSGWDGEEATGWDFDDEAAENDDGNEDGAQADPGVKSPEPEPRILQSTEPSHLDPEPQKSLVEDVGEEEEAEGDGWGWDDEAEAEKSEIAVESTTEKTPEAPKTTPSPPTKSGTPTDESWASDSWSHPDSSPTLSDPEPKTKAGPPPPIVAPAPTPKLAKRLEKFSAKAKSHSASSTPIQSPSVVQTPPPPPTPQRIQPKVVAQPQPRKPVPVPPVVSQPQPQPIRRKVEKESYLISIRAKTILQLAEQVLREGEELFSSNVFSKLELGKSTNPGEFLISASPSVLDLQRALYPITHAAALERDTNLCMRWSNDCTFLSKEAGDLRRKDGAVDARWVETGERLQMLGELNFENAVARQQDLILKILAQAEGFIHAARSDRYLECRDAVEGALQEIRDVAEKWKGTLTRSNYLRAIGQVVDDALFRIMDDILALPDIPEADSEKLSEFCEMLNPLEDLFIYEPGHQSVVGSFVPLWFKFSYLSWLIKGSIADISYLFEQGMLVDYEIDELVRLLRALFAETPLRENTIAKIMQGHPSPEES